MGDWLDEDHSRGYRDTIIEKTKGIRSTLITDYLLKTIKSIDLKYLADEPWEHLMIRLKNGFDIEIVGDVVQTNITIRLYLRRNNKTITLP